MSDIYHLFPANILGNQISVDSELSTLSVSGTAVIEDLISRKPNRRYIWWGHTVPTV